MQNTILEEKATKVASLHGIEVYRIAAAKFKTNGIYIFFQDNLSRESATKNALMPAVLRRGCETYPTFQSIALRLEELYGASFDCGVYKKGERHLIQFYTEFLSDQYVPEGSNQFENALQLLFEIITRPVLENGAFKPDYLEQEKENLRKLIEGRVNDKMSYSLERCFEEMCKDEPYAINDYGFVADLGAISAGELCGHYKQVLETYPMTVYLTGDLDQARVEKALSLLSGWKRGEIRKMTPTGIEYKPGEVRQVEEKMNVNQGKLCLGFRTQIPPGGEDYYKLLVYNGILGGGVHSKLFQNVREKASLAYYASSRLEKFKGLMVVSSGIEIKNKAKAQEIILQQLEEMRKGNISDYEFDSTLKTIETGVKSLQDSQPQIVDFYLSQAVAGTEDTFHTIIDKVCKVTRKDVVEIASKIRLDTVYFLTAKELEA